MNYLAIDTSGKNLTVIICKDGKIYSHHDTECGVNHSVEVMPCVEKLAQEANFDFNNADFFVAVVGAGSFTGIRIGVATIKAMCFAFNKPCLSITSFDTIAYNEIGEKVLAVIDAKHNAYYVCGYNGLNVEIEPCYLGKNEVEELAKTYKVLSFAPIDGFDCKVVSIKDGLVKAIAQKQENVTFDIEKLEPLYVRKSQAEEGR